MKPSPEGPVAPPEALLAELSARHRLGYVPELRWANYRTTAGRAHYDERTISLSRAVHPDEGSLRATLIHEFAHLLAVAREGKAGRGHGPAWRRAMAELGAEPEVRHSMPVRRNVSRQTVVYRCRACGATIERKRRLPRRGRWVHARCGGELTLVGIRPTGDP